MAFTTHLRSSCVASCFVEDAVEASDALGGGFSSTRELADALASCCGSEVDEGFGGMALISWRSSLGLERASATTFALPLRYRISVVYSEIHAS